MTNREKFKQIFGVDFEDFNENELDMDYSGAKAYLCIIESKNQWKKENERPKEIIVSAPNKTIARKRAIEQFGKRKFYHRQFNYYMGVPISEKPIEETARNANYKITVTKIKGAK